MTHCQGTVSVGGIDVRKYDLVTLRDSVAMVCCRRMCFLAEQLKKNLRWGKEDATDEENPQRLYCS